MDPLIKRNRKSDLYTLKPIEKLNIAVRNFLRNHRTATVTYIFDDYGNIEGIVLHEFKNRIDRQEKEGKGKWKTARPTYNTDLKGLWLYIAETDFDYDTGKWNQTPKIRFRGKIKEVAQLIAKDFPEARPQR